MQFMHWMKNECTSDKCSASISLLKETYAKQITIGSDPRLKAELLGHVIQIPPIKLDKRNCIASFIPLW